MVRLENWAREPNEYTYKKPFMYHTGFIVSSLAILLNVMEVVLVMHSLKRKLTIPLIYILNLSLADIMIGSIANIVLSLILTVAADGGSPKSEMACKILSRVDVIGSRVCGMVAIFSIVAMTIDRVLCTIRPLQYRQIKKRYAVFSCVSVWFMALLLVSSSYLLTADDRPFWNFQNVTALVETRLDHVVLETRTRFQYDGFWRNELTQMQINITDFERRFNLSHLTFDRYFFVKEKLEVIRSSSFRGRTEEQGKFEYFVYIVSINIAVMVLIASYSKILFTLKRDKQNIARQNSTQGTNKRMLKMIVLTVSMFIITWVPLSVYFACFMSGILNHTPSQVAHYENAFRILPLLNSAINPFIYFKCMGHFRRWFRTFTKLLNIQVAENSLSLNNSTRPKTESSVPDKTQTAINQKNDGQRIVYGSSGVAKSFISKPKEPGLAPPILTLQNFSAEREIHV